MKITKKELREMIRECLREELQEVVSNCEQPDGKTQEESLEESAGTVMSWDDTIDAADNLLAELINVTGNTEYDDGDGYWSGEEGEEWTNRYLYYAGELNNYAGLESMCEVYSSKLPNVQFYCYEDTMSDEPVSEIGYTATNPDFVSAY